MARVTGNITMPISQIVHLNYKQIPNLLKMHHHLPRSTPLYLWNQTVTMKTMKHLRHLRPLEHKGCLASLTFKALTDHFN